MLRSAPIHWEGGARTLPPTRRPIPCIRVALSGRLRLAGAITGWLDSLGAEGTLEGSGLVLGEVRARRLSGTITSPGCEHRPAARWMSRSRVSLPEVAARQRRAALELPVGWPNADPYDRSDSDGSPWVAALEFAQSPGYARSDARSLAVYTHDNAWHLAARPFPPRRTGLRSTDSPCAARWWGLVTARRSLRWYGREQLRSGRTACPSATSARSCRRRTHYGGLARWDVRWQASAPIRRSTSGVGQRGLAW